MAKQTASQTIGPSFHHILTPFDYGQLVGATLLGYLIWGDFPDGWTWLGIAIIICSGVYIAHREARR